jgi:hypothetical protein
MCTEPEKDTAGLKNRNTDPQQPKHDAFEKMTLATAIVGVIILCIYTGLTGYQAYIAKDSAQRQLRAYVSAAVEKHPDLDSANLPEIVIVYKNNGQTPAYMVEARVVVFVAGAQLTDSDISEARTFLDKLRKSESVLFPGQEFREASVPGIGIPLSQDQKIAVSMGAQVLWIIGEVNYTDAFGSLRFNHFRLFMGGVDVARFHKFFWADTGNEAN